MFKPRSFLRNALLALLVSASSFASADTLHVEIDTSSFGTTQGWLDLMFVPFNGKTADATAVLSDLIGFDGAVGADIWGDVSGSVAEGYTLNNSGVGADLFHAVTLGGTVSFNVDFSGAVDAAVNRAISTLSVALYGSDQSTLLGNGDAVSGSLVQLYWLPSKTSASDGTVSYAVYDSIASVGPATAVPEASTWAMMGLGIGLIGLVRRRTFTQRFAA